MLHKIMALLSLETIITTKPISIHTETGNTRKRKLAKRLRMIFNIMNYKYDSLYELVS